MKVSLTKGEGLSRQLDVIVPAAEVDAVFKARLEEIAKTIKLDGFRPGKVPLDVVKKRVGEELGQEVANVLVNRYLPKALEQEKLNIAGQPHVHVGAGHGAGGSAVEGEDFHFHAHVDVYPEFEPKGYTKLKLTRQTAEVSEDMVKASMERLKSQLQTYERKKDGKAAKGDRLTITGQGYTKEGKEEKAFEGGKLENFKVVLGSGSLIPGFEDGLLGTKEGDEVDVEVTFPKDYHAKELAGKPSIFKLKVLEIESPKDEELSDETVKQLGIASLDALKELLRSGAARDLSAASDQRVKRAMLDALDEANKMDLPQGLVMSEHQALWRAQLQELQQRQLPIEALGKSVEEAQNELKPLAERRVKLGLVLAEIAKKEKITVEAKDINDAVENHIANAGPQAAQVKQYFADPRNREQLAGPIMEDKVTKFIMEQAEVKEEKVEPMELLSELQ